MSDPRQLPWPAVTAVVTVLSLSFGGLMGGYIQNLRVGSAINKVEVTAEKVEENLREDAKQRAEIDALKDAVDDLRGTNREIRNLLATLVSQGGIRR